MSIFHDFSVHQTYGAVSMLRHFRVVRDDDDGSSLTIQIIKDFHDVRAILGIQVPGRLVRQDNFRIIDQCPRNGYSLLLAP